MAAVCVDSMRMHRLSLHVRRVVADTARREDGCSHVKASAQTFSRTA